MRYLSLILVWNCLLAGVYQQAKGQSTFSISVQDASFDSLVQKLEAASAYQFYFDKKDTDSLRISISEKNITLQQLLQQVFDKTDFNFAIDSTQRVFISRQQTISTNLTPNFFDNGTNSNDSLTDASTAWPNEAAEKTLNVAEENKLLEIGSATLRKAQGKYILSGYIKDKRNGEAISGATIMADSSIVVSSGQFGYYSITLGPGRHQLKINSAGMTETRKEILLHSSGKLNIEMKEYIESLKTVVVNAQKKLNTQSLQMGVTRLNIKAIKQVPVVFGETDVLKVVLALPGVTSVGEASNGYNVRGGSTDQNLILFNDATVYNPSHLFGFFSAFNPDVVKGIELYKSAIPEKYGGRLASVLDITMKDGNTKKWTGNAGIGPLTAKFSMEGPLKKEKTTLVIGGRTTYSNWLLRSLKDAAYSNSQASFYDLNMHLVHQVNTKNALYLTGYLSNDDFGLNNDTIYKYSNKNINLKWKHIFNNGLYSLVSAGIDNYEYAVSSNTVPVNGYRLSFNIRQYNLRTTFTYSPNNKHQVNFGLHSTLYHLRPGTFEPVTAQSLVVKKDLAKEQALETALFIGDQFSINSKLSVNAGVRYSLYNLMGAKEVYQYAAGVPRTVNSITDTLLYAAGKNIQTYHGPEIRLSLRYALSDNASIKISYNSLLQYIHMLSNTTAIAPTDTWKLSDTYIKPQKGNQFSIGFYRNFQSNSIETSLEAYFKQTSSYLDYKSGASLLLNKHIETDVFNTRGKAYGIELLVKKTSGRLNGWISYSYSRTLLQMNDPLAGEIINGGKYYPANFDKPHNLNFIGNYRFSHRYSVSANFVYSTGRPITLPLAVFDIGGAPSLYYSERNEYRIPNYIRADFSIHIDGNHKVKQRIHNSWSAGVYNLLARQNPYSVYFINENGKVKGYQLSIFGTAIPFITYNIRF
jgi:hypothetical protein